MATIVLKIGRKTVETDAIDVDMGTSTSCLAAINDPVAAARHAWIRARAGLFLLEDADSASGTWKNGVPVTRAVPLSDGDEIVIGCTKIDVKIAADAPVPSLELTFHEKTFFFEPSKKHQVIVDGVEKAIVSGDAERWVRDEVAFGRFRALKVVCLLAVVATIAFLASSSSRTVRAKVLQPGDLHAKHAMLFDNQAPAGASPLLLASFAIAHEQGCSACHDTFGGAPASKCAACHADMMRERHPFAMDRSAAPLTAGIELGSETCSTCHTDHRGRVPAEGAFVPTPAMVASSCQGCHTTSVPQPQARKLESVPTHAERIAYDAFSHADHAAATCDTCHAKSGAPERAAGRDFARVEFRSCMGCHASEDTASKFRRDPVLASRAPPVAREHEVSLAWHGSGDAARCLSCHTKLHDGALRQVQTRDVDHMDVHARRRGHEELFAGHVSVRDSAGRTRACAECHVDGSPMRSNETYTGRFDHAQHLASLAPATSDAARALSDACAQCHDEQRSAQHLAGRAGPASDDIAGAPAYPGPDIRACAACHKDQQNAALIARLDPSDEGRLALRADFPHARHVSSSAESLREGCFACHTFEDQGKSICATTKPAAAACMPCHQSHANVGGDGCSMCHPDSAKREPDIAMLGPDTRDERAFKQRSPTPGFSHDTRGHDGTCTTCHTGADKAATIREVHFPAESDAVCWKCHVEDARQFHWRGAPSARAKAR
jgi:hypothetical protein